MRLVKADVELALLTAQRDEAREQVERHRELVLDLERRAARAEGEVVALRQTVELLRQSFDDGRLREANAALLARVAELEGRLSSCLVRATTQPVGWPTANGVSRG